MTSKELIDAALAAKTAFDQAQAAMQQAGADLQAAQDNLTAANQALHDDLSANGPCVVVDTTTTPATCIMYSALDPDTYLATEIRVAA
jgi:hypothetical protein